MKPIDLINMGFLVDLINDIHSDALEDLRLSKNAEAVKKIRKIKINANTLQKIAEKIIDEEESSKNGK